MDQRQTAEMAALISAHSVHLIEGPAQIPNAALQDYWVNCRRRLIRWTQALDQTTENLAGSEVGDDRQFSILSVLEEIFVSEILTRVWGAILTATDHERRVTHAEPIARNALSGHLKAREIALRRMVNEMDVSLTKLSDVDRLRRRTERWTDLLLGHLLRRFDVSDFAFDPKRALDFGGEQSLGFSPASRPIVWDLLLASLRLSFPKKPCCDPISIQNHRAIIASVLACFPSDAFEADGPFKSVPVLRIGRSGLSPDRLYQQQEESTNLDSSSISFSKLRRYSDSED